MVQAACGDRTAVYVSDFQLVEAKRIVQGDLSMKTIVTLTLNPAIDKSSSVDHVVAERKLYCTTPSFDPGGGAVNVSRAIKKLGGESLLLYPAGGITGKRLEELFNGLNSSIREVSILCGAMMNFTFSGAEFI